MAAVNVSMNRSLVGLTMRIPGFAWPGVFRSKLIFAQFWNDKFVCVNSQFRRYRLNEHQIWEVDPETGEINVLNRGGSDENKSNFLIVAKLKQCGAMGVAERNLIDR